MGASRLVAVVVLPCPAVAGVLLCAMTACRRRSHGNATTSNLGVAVAANIIQTEMTRRALHLTDVERRISGHRHLDVLVLRRESLYTDVIESAVESQSPIFSSSQRVSVCSIKCESGSSPCSMLELTSLSIFARITSSMTLLYFERSSCRTFPLSPVVPVSSSCLSASRDADLSVNRKAWRTNFDLPFHKLRSPVRVLVAILYRPSLRSVEDALS